MFKKIVWQLMFSYLLVIIFSMLLVGVISFRSVESYFINSLETSLSYDVRLVARLWEKHFLDPSSLSPREKRTVKMLTEGLTWQSANSRITVFDGKGKVLMDTGHLGEIPPERSELLDKALYGQETSQVFRSSPAIGVARISLCCPVKIVRGSYSGEEVVGAVFATTSLVYVREILSGMTREYGAGVIFSIIILAVFSAFLSSFIANPIRSITKAAEKMASGDLTTSVKMNRGDEIGELSRQFDNMRIRLQSTLRELLDEEKKLQDVLSHMSDGVIVFNAERNIMMVNSVACNFLGCFTLEGLKDNMDSDSLPFSRLRELFENVISTGYSAIETMRGLSGGRVVKIGYSPLRAGNHEIQGVIFLFHDITELSRLDDMRVDFVSNVSHELKTPLASIKGFTELLLDGALEDGEKARHFISSVNKEADRLARLVKSLLDLSRLDSGMVKMELDFFDLSMLVSDVIARLSIKASGKNISLDMQLENQLNVYSNSDRVQQVIINLVDNAIRYSPSDSKITVKLFSDDDFAEFHVIDEGPGIPLEDRLRIFERFYRIDKARSREQGGSGLGLAIVKQIVETLGGRVWIADETEHGCDFAFTLPKAGSDDLI